MRLSRRPPGLAARPRGNRPPISDRRDPPRQWSPRPPPAQAHAGLPWTPPCHREALKGQRGSAFRRHRNSGGARPLQEVRGRLSQARPKDFRVSGLRQEPPRNRTSGEQTSRSARVCHPVHVECGSLQGIAKSASRMYVALDKKKSWHHSEGLLRLSRSDMNFGQSQSVDLASESIPCSLAERIWEAFPRQQTYLHLAVSGIECVGYPLSSRCRRDRGDRRRNVHTEWRQRPQAPPKRTDAATPAHVPR